MPITLSFKNEEDRNSVAFALFRVGHKVWIPDFEYEEIFYTYQICFEIEDKEDMEESNGN